MTQLICYPRMSTCSRRAMLKRYSNPLIHPPGTLHRYNPRGKLLLRLQRQLRAELGIQWSIDRIWRQIKDERRYLLIQQGYNVEPWEQL
ncbi:hypothetical protein HC928_11280 [bacterium]|nr:hypothetical protein [bacterium]